MEKKTARGILLALIVAIACIAIGVYNVWRSFERFDESILKEKDDQFYTLMRSDDINIENSLNALEREAETYFGRERLKHVIKEWRADGFTDRLMDYLSLNTLQTNPLYSDLIMINKEKVFITASGSRDYTFITTKDINGFRICEDGRGTYYLAYEHDYSKDIRFDVLIDPVRLYRTATVSNTERELLLIDASGHIMLTSANNEIHVDPVDSSAEPKIEICRDYMLECQQNGVSDGMSVDLTDEDGQEYTVRMVVMPNSITVNGEFTIGIIADYGDAIAPSRKAAEEILLFGGLAVLGVIGLLLLLIFYRRENAANTAELRALKKKNETMEEINQKMQTLAHHQRLETIGTMTASIAHDFNNLLTPIMGYSIMTMEMLPADATDLQENLLEVYNASVKAKEIVSRLADITKKGKEENYKDVEIDEIIKSALKVTLPSKPDNVEVRANFSAGDTLIRADKTQISQMIMNIVLNAYDAMREKGGTLLVSTRISGEEVLIRCKDTGCGMDAETVTKIFDPFYTTKESGKGTGLGLAIVAQIIESHGGRIYVDSEPGAGTEFRIYIPCAGESIENLAWGPNGEGKFDTRRYDVNLIRRELARIQAEKDEEEELS